MQQDNTPNQSQPAYVPEPPTPGPVAPINDGHTLGIVGLVLGVFGLWPIGLPLSIVSVVRAGKAGASKTLGIVGIVLNVLSILVVLILVGLTLAAYDGVQARAKTAAATTTAWSVLKRAEAYNALHETGDYPTSLADFSANVESDLQGISTPTLSISDTVPAQKGVVNYTYCSAEGAQVSYYDESTSRVIILPAGDAPTDAPCK